MMEDISAKIGREIQRRSNNAYCDDKNTVELLKDADNEIQELREALNQQTRATIVLLRHGGSSQSDIMDCTSNARRVLGANLDETVWR